MRTRLRNRWARDLSWVCRSEMPVGPQAEPNTTGALPLILHASCVALDQRGVLILGASGRGKSGLALRLMSYGASLVADDRTCLYLQDDSDGPLVFADAPQVLRGLIEARGIGLLTAEAVGPVPVTLVVDLDQTEETRLPPLQHMDLLGQRLPLVHMVDSPAFPAAILQYLKGGRSA